jgi:hypothetical protein
VKLILISNFNDETVAEKLLGSGLSEHEARVWCDCWNHNNASECSRYYCVVRSEEYILWRGMADLVGDPE